MVIKPLPSLTALQRLREMRKIGFEIPVPWTVTRLFPEQGRVGLEIFGTQVSLGGDYVDVKEAREALTWLTKQFGGVVKWEKE